MANITSSINATLKRIKDPVIRERLMMIRASYKEPLRDVAASYRCTHGKVDFWKKRYEKQGLKGLQTKLKNGRPKKISANVETKIRRMVRKHNIKQGWRTKQVRSIIHQEAGVKYSFRHTIRIIQSWKLSKITPRPRYAFSKKEDRKAFLKKTSPTWHINH